MSLQNNDVEVVLKGLIEDILNGFLGKINSDELKGIIYKLISDKYDEGLQRAELNFDTNFLPDYRSVSFLQRFAFENVSKATDDLKDNLRKEVSMAVMNRESTSQIRKHIREVLDTSIDRAAMIQKTELNRAFNMGHFQGAKESGLDVVKKWDAQPERISRAGNMVPCKHCEYLDGQVVGVDEHFTDDQGLKIFLPPHHPNCACRVVYVQREDLEK